MLLQRFNILFIFYFIFSISFLNAQTSKVRIAITSLKPHYNQLDKAKAAIDIAILNEKTSEKAKTWKVRGEVYHAIALTKEAKFEDLCENPLQIAFDSYKNALKLDKKELYKDEIYNQLTSLSTLMTNKAIENFDNKLYSNSLASFEGVLEINTIVNDNIIDSIIIYNAGLAAEKAMLYDKAIKYFEMSTNIKHSGSNVYGYMANIELLRGDTLRYLNYLKKGIEVYPDASKPLIITLIRYYLTNDESNLALQYLRTASEKDTQNPIFYFAQGAIYDNLKQHDSAIYLYQKAIKIKPDYFDAFYNLGALYFNKGSVMLKEANSIPPNEEDNYNKAVQESYSELEKALPFLEIAHEIDSLDMPTIKSLKDIYFTLRNDNTIYMDKYLIYTQIILNFKKK